jgi:hypothetical protein
MRNLLCTICVVSLLLLIGCQGNPFNHKGGNKNNGGIGRMIYQEITNEVFDKDGKVTERTTDKKVDGHLSQPENPETPTGMTFDLKDLLFGFEIPGANFIPVDPSNLPKIDYTGKAFGQLIVIGGILLVAGVILTILSFKFGTWLFYAGLGASGGGVILMAISAAISASMQQLGILFIGVIIVLLVAGVVTFFLWKREKKALTQTTKAINEVKKEDPEAWAETIKPALEESQDENVKKYLENAHLNIK